MSKKFKAHDEVSQVHEIRVKVDGETVSVIYGQYSEGGFIAAPSREFCVKASSPTDVIDNALNIVFSTSGRREEAKIIAEAIKEHWESIENKER